MGRPQGEQISEWDDEAFRARVTAIADRQGRRLDEVCITAGLAHDTLLKPNRKGRNITTLLALARSLNVPLVNLLFEDGEQPQPIDSAALRRLGLLANVATHLYASLTDPTRPLNPEIDRVMRIVMSLLEDQPGSPEPF